MAAGVGVPRRFGSGARRTLRRMLRRSTGSVVLATAIACAVIAAAIVTGLRVPGVQELASFPPRSVLDYDSTFRSGLAPLRPGFIREVLGGGVQPTAESAADRARRGPESVPRLVADPFGPPRITNPHPFTNDDMEDARVIAGIPFTGKTNTSKSSREPGEPQNCSSVGGTAWYEYRSIRDESLIANTFGTDHAVHLGVFTRSSDGSFTRVGCDSDVRGAALVQFPAGNETTYLFQIAAQAVGGRLVFNLEPTGVTELVSSNPDGKPGSGASWAASLSADGARVAFWSHATDLHPRTPRAPCHTQGGMPPMSYEEATAGDYGTPCPHVYVRDRTTDAMFLVSVSSSGEPGNLNSAGAWISGNGRYVAFASLATNLVGDDGNHAWDIFVHDLEGGRTERVSVSSAGEEADGDITRQRETSGSPSMSHDGRYVAFASVASNLVTDDENDAGDVFVHDRLTRRTERVSVSSNGAEAESSSGAPSISPDGRYVFFLSRAANLIPQSTNGFQQAFLHDRVTRVTEIVSISPTGEPGNGDVFSDRVYTRPVISADGRYVVFESSADNLDRDDDTNEAADVFVRDRVRRTTSRISVSSSGEEGDAASIDPAISSNGRYVAFTSSAESLAEGRKNEPTILVVNQDLYVRDLLTQTTTLITVAPRGNPSGVRYPSLSADGRTISFSAICYDTTCDVTPSPTMPIFQDWVHDRPRGRP